MRIPSPPAPSHVDKLAREAITLAQRLKADYRLAWDQSYVRLGSGTPELGRGHRYDDDGAPSNSLGSHIAEQEGRRTALSLGAKRLEKAVEGLRSANGLIDPAHKPPQSNWTAQDLREAEARYQDAKRLKGRKWSA